MNLRILNVVESFDGQAIEAWLERMVAESTSRQCGIDWTFFCTLPGSGRYDQRVRELGATVVHSTVHLRDTTSFLFGLRRVMRDGAFDVLHCHHDLMSGAYLLAAAGIPFQKRIIHVHNTTPSVPTNSAGKARVASLLLRQLCLRWADHIVGVSKDALAALTRGSTSQRRRDLVIPGCVDTTLFRDPAAKRRNATRHGRTPDEQVLLFVGRLVDSKNPLFCLKILKRLRERGRNVSLQFVGTGPLDDAVVDEARILGIADRVHVMGWQEDVASLMLGADVLLWTALESQREGMGLVAVEAQTAGLPVIASNSLPKEAFVVPKGVHSLSLAEGVEEWANAVEHVAAKPRTSSEECVTRVERSPCSLERSATALFQLYAESNRT
jgi:glycosyltransferase EpsF